MKYLILPILCYLLISCGGNQKPENETFSKITISLDTVIVDSGEEFLYLQDRLYLSVLSKDQQFLYNYNESGNSLEKIDLDNLILNKKIKFEKEGPNGIGDYISNFSLTSEGNFMIWFYGLNSVFDQEANLVKKLDLEEIASEVIRDYDAYPNMLYDFEGQKDRVVGFFITWKDYTYFLLDFDLENKSYKRIELPEFKKLLDYRVEITNDGRSVGSYGVGIYPSKNDNKIIFANNAVNEISIYDIKTDSLYIKSWDSSLLGSKKNYLPPKQVESESGQLGDILRKSKEEISYGGLIWDKGRRQYFRLSHKENFSNEKDERGNYKGISAEVYLSVFDEDFELINETILPELNKIPPKHFVKDGKIWLYENIDDELGFVRLTIN
ncbi:DUF4221 family protein [Belliella pelovolcani]|uniref:TolB-like 6-blade propeller-like n=1 Tax=Belliella pelovolcani TaxID=529505 RepID=A0A1N7KMQ6_9BACT|nr:DUF4221 family protein [Belliella pelovolcani]SIS62776.1 protein of unknown function [Belliella pelovolcani]